MKIQGAEMISRYTQSSFRVLFLFGAGLLLTWKFGFNATGESWSLFSSRELTPKEFVEAVFWAGLALSIAHLINWLADFTSYTKWFQIQSASMQDFFSAGSIEQQKPVPEALRERTGYLDDALTKVDEANKVFMDAISNVSDDASTPAVEASEKLKEALQSLRDGNLSEIQGFADRFGPSFKSLSRLARFYLLFWLLAPIVISVVGILLLYIQLDDFLALRI